MSGLCHSGVETMSTKKRAELLHICSDLAFRLRQLLKYKPNSNWLKDAITGNDSTVSVTECLRNLNAAHPRPPVSITTLKRRLLPNEKTRLRTLPEYEVANPADDTIQELQSKVDESIGITSLRLALHRDWSGNLVNTIPIFATVRPSTVGNTSRGVPSPFEMNVLKGFDNGSGLTETLMHLEQLLRNSDKEFASTSPEFDNGAESIAPSTATEISNVKKHSQKTQAATFGATAKKLDRRERAYQEFKACVGPILVKQVKIEIDKVDLISRCEFMRLADTIELHEINNVISRMSHIERKHKNGTVVRRRNGEAELEFGSITTLKRDMSEWRLDQTDGLDSKPSV